VIGIQHEEARSVLDRAARRLGIAPLWQNEDFHGSRQDGRLVYQDDHGLLDLPPPALLGAHQFDNAALAIAASRHFGLPVDERAIAEGLRMVNWPARMTPLQTGPLRDLLGPGAELWLDGIHNVHGAAAVATTLRELDRARPAPLVLIMGLMNNRSPSAVLAPFAGMARQVLTLTIPGEANAHKAAYIATEARRAGFDARPMRSVAAALRAAASVPDARVLICGSLYLAGDVLARNGTPPD